MEWISVKNEIPEDGLRLLLYTDVPDEYGKERIGVYLGDTYWTLMGGDYYKQKSINVTHWMPLPEPPESED